MKRWALVWALVAWSTALGGVALWQACLLRTQPIAAAGVNRAGTSSRSSSPPRPAANEQTLGGTPHASRASGDGKSASRRSSQGEAAAADRVGPVFDWRQVESQDYRAYVKNLRAIGCPEQTVRDIVSADILQAFAARRAEVLAARYQDFKYWKADSSETAARAGFERGKQAVESETGTALREILGPDAVLPDTTREWRAAEIERQLADLPAEKRSPVEAILLDNSENDHSVKDLASGMNLTENLEERSRIMQNYDCKRQALSALLPPEQCEQVELATSWTAENLRRALVQFQPTEEEFRIIFRQWQPFDEKVARMRANGEAAPGGLEEELHANLREQLGQARYEEYKAAWWK